MNTNEVEPSVCSDGGSLITTLSSTILVQEQLLSRYRKEIAALTQRCEVTGAELLRESELRQRHLIDLHATVARLSEETARGFRQRDIVLDALRQLVAAIHDVKVYGESERPHEELARRLLEAEELLRVIEQAKKK